MSVLNRVETNERVIMRFSPAGRTETLVFETKFQTSDYRGRPLAMALNEIVVGKDGDFGSFHCNISQNDGRYDLVIGNSIRPFDLYQFRLTD